MSMYKAKQIFLLFVSIILLFKSATSEDQVTFMAHHCSEGVYNDQGSDFQSNLNRLLSNLSSEAATKQFYNTTEGEGVNKVYGLFLCNGAYTSELCRDCITVAAGQIQQKCPNNVQGIIWYGECMLRYANRYIFSLEDDSVHFVLNYGPKIYKEFDQQLSSMLVQLTDKVTGNSSSQRYATGVVYVLPIVTLTGYVDCTPDITPLDCRRCLQTALNRVGVTGIQLNTILQPSCRLFYFYYDFRPGKIFGPAAIAATIFAAVAGISLILNMYLYFRKAKERGKPTGLEEMESMENLHLQYSSIKSATDNFAYANKIGEGGFGEVYMGTLPDGQAIAVKRLSNSSEQGIREFKSESSLVAKLQHKNLVKLFGFCLEGNEKLLVYEFVPNKSLDRYLFDKNRGVLLKWDDRKRIILGIARGLVYLHEDSRVKIIHRDLKPSNILLDEEMNPKIADFGMAKLFGVDQTQGNTSRIAGTFGYMAPEYTKTGHFSVKSDVFSFGVILLEVISGRRNTVFNVQENDEILLNHAWRLWNENAILQLLDANIKDDCSEREVTRCIHIALLCIQEDAARRPTIALVLSMLSSQSVPLPALTAPPTFPCLRSLSKPLNNSNAIFTEEIFTQVDVR